MIDLDPEDIRLATEVDNLVDLLARPIYNLRMARGMFHSRNEGQLKSALVRAARARKEIDEMVHRYAGRTKHD